MSAVPRRSRQAVARAGSAPAPAPATRPRPAPARPRPAPARPRPARESDRPRRRAAAPRPAPRRRQGPGRALLIAVPIVALLLFGIVWVNVAKLGLTTQTGAVVERSRAIEAQNLRLETRLERRDATVIDRAREDLGMIPSSGESVTYVQAR